MSVNALPFACCCLRQDNVCQPPHPVCINPRVLQGSAAAGTDPAAAALSARTHSGAADVQGKATPGAAKVAADGKGGAVGKVVSAVSGSGSAGWSVGAAWTSFLFLP